MIRFLFLFLLLPCMALAQSTANRVTPGYLTTQGCAGSASSCFVPTGGLSPIKGFGTLAVTSSSALVSTLTLGPNASAWSSAQGLVTFYNTGGTTLYLCPLGGTCATTSGIPIAAGGNLPVFNPSTSATVIDATTGTLVATW